MTASALLASEACKLSVEFFCSGNFNSMHRRQTIKARLNFGIDVYSFRRPTPEGEVKASWVVAPAGVAIDARHPFKEFPGEALAEALAAGTRPTVGHFESTLAWTELDARMDALHSFIEQLNSEVVRKTRSSRKRHLAALARELSGQL